MLAPSAVDEYIASFPEEKQYVLRRVRAALRAGVPDADETVRYGMPAVLLGGRYAIHFAAWKNHIGIYPVATTDDPIEAEIAPYRAAKDALNFPYSKPIPYELIERVARFLAERSRLRSTTE